MDNFALTITLYNPNMDLIINKVKELKKFFSCLILIDNSDDGRELSSFFNDSRVIYISYKENKGIAFAVNEACRIALSKGYSWCVTMDQDSDLPADYLENVTAIIQNGANKIGIIAPLYKSSELGIVEKTLGFKEVKEVISSGSCINLDAFNSVNGQNEDYFIDCVDFDFCWKLRKHGYSILQMQNVVLNHNLGSNGKEIRIFGKHLVYITNHSPLRKYYMVRNSLYLANEYKTIFKLEAKEKKRKTSKVIIKSLFFERKKLLSLIAVFLGVRDFKKNVKGKCMYKILLGAKN